MTKQAGDVTATREDATYDSSPGFETRLGEAVKQRTKRRAQWGLRLALGTLGWLTRERSRSLPPLRAGDPTIRRILVTRVDLLGDLVLSLPAVRALRRAYPEAEIDLLTLRSTADILQGDPDVSRSLTFDPSAWRRPTGLLKMSVWRDAFTMLRTLRTARYDLAISISGDIGSILTRLSNARRRVGYAREAYPFFMTDTLPGGRYLKHQHEVFYVQDLARRAGGIIEPGDARLRLVVQQEAARRMKETLHATRRTTGAMGPVVAIHAGARNGQAKRWPTEHIAALAERLVGELDALVLLTGAPNEAPLARAIERQCQKPITNLTGKTSIPELVALMAASDLLVTGDSGPMHIACAVRTPVVALHGPTDPAISGPTAPDAIVLRERLWCSPCYDASATAECRFHNPVCMKSLAPGIVFGAAKRQLARHGLLVNITSRTAPQVDGKNAESQSLPSSLVGQER